MLNSFVGVSYPVVENAMGYFRGVSGLDVVKADLLSLLMTNPTERVMMPDFGTDLRRLLFDPNDMLLQQSVKEVIANSISKWEPRVTIQNILVGAEANIDLNSNDDGSQDDYMLPVVIRFVDRDDISDVQELRLDVPLNATQNTQSSFAPGIGV